MALPTPTTNTRCRTTIEQRRRGRWSNPHTRGAYNLTALNFRSIPWPNLHEEISAQSPIPLLFNSTTLIIATLLRPKPSKALVTNWLPLAKSIEIVTTIFAEVRNEPIFVIDTKWMALDIKTRIVARSEIKVRKVAKYQNCLKEIQTWSR